MSDHSWPYQMVKSLTIHSLKYNYTLWQDRQTGRHKYDMQDCTLRDSACWRAAQLTNNETMEQTISDGRKTIVKCWYIRKKWSCTEMHMTGTPRILRDSTEVKRKWWPILLLLMCLQWSKKESVYNFLRITFSWKIIKQIHQLWYSVIFTICRLASLPVVVGRFLRVPVGTRTNLSPCSSLYSKGEAKAPWN